MRVVDESKVPVSDAEIASASQVISKTGGDGGAEVTVGGREGATYLLDVRCPNGEGNGLRVDTESWAGFWSAIVHAMRNAVDHGLEEASERAEAGRHGAGRIALRTFVDGPSFLVEIEDDGRGIDWNKLSSKARAMGVTAQAIEELLFIDGLSTAEQVTEVSGRGVGLGALRAATVELGGRLEVTSARGVGTRVRMVFPERATMPGLYDEALVVKAA